MIEQSVAWTDDDRREARGLRVNLDDQHGVASVEMCDWCHGRNIREDDLVARIAALETDVACKDEAVKKLATESAAWQTNAEKWFTLFCLLAVLPLGYVANLLYQVYP